MSGTSKANQRQHKKHEAYFKSQVDRTIVNKVIAMVRHFVRYGDRAMVDRIRAKFPKIQLTAAANKVPKGSKLYGALKELAAG